MMRASVFRLSPLFLLAAALMALAVFFAAGVPSAQAQNFVSDHLTVDHSGGEFGCDDSSTALDNCSTAFDDNEFTYSGATYRITALIWDSVINRMTVYVSKDGSTLSGSQIKADLGSLRLNLEERVALPFSSALAGTDRVWWSYDPASDWTDGQRVKVTLSQPHPATCSGAADSSLNPTDLRVFPGKRVLTLAWLNPDVDRGIRYAVRWRKSGTTAWLNPNGAVGEVFHQQPRYTHDITGLEDGAGYEAQVRIVLATTSREHNSGRYQPGGCSEWVSVTRATRGIGGVDPAPDTIGMSTTGALREGGPSVNVFFELRSGEREFDTPARAGGGVTLGADIPAEDPPGDTLLTRYYVRWVPDIAEGAIVAVMQMYVPEDDVDNNCRTHEYSVTFPAEVAGGTYLSKDFSFTIVDNDGTADTGCTGAITGSGAQPAGGQNDPCDNCGTGGDTGGVSQGQADYSGLIARMYDWRNDWDRALLAFGETVDDATLTPMTAAEAQGFADRGSGWERWVEVAKALRVLQNQAPTVSAAIADATIVSDSGTKQVSLSGVFDDPDGDSLTMSAASSDEATATASVSSDGASLTVTARLRGTATITVTAADSYGGTVEDAFTVTVKAAPVVASSIGDLSGLETGATQEVSLSGVFSDADGDSLTITATSSDEAKTTVTVSADQSKLTLSGVAEGTATITVTAQDSDGNRVSDAFQVEVSAESKYAALIARMYQWRNDPQWVSEKPHTDRWDRALLAFGETVADATLTPMTAAEAQGFADRGWERWVEVAAALRVLQNRAPTVSASIADVTIVSDSGTKQVSLAGVFDDADGDSLTMSATSSAEAVATASVSSGGSSLTVTARLRGTATITVAAADSYGGTVSDSFTVTVKAAPVVASAIADVSGLEAGSTQDVSLSGVFSDADGDALTVTAASGDDAKATVSVSSDGSTLTLTGVAEGTATITVTAQDTDGNRVTDDFDVSVVAQQQPPEPPNEAPTVSAAIADATIVNESGTHAVSLSGVFSDADNDSLTMSAASSDEGKATVSVSSGGSSLTVNAQARGTAVITVTAADGNGGTVSEDFTVTVKAAPAVASAVADMSLKAGATQEEGGAQDVSLAAVFSDADGDALTFSAETSDFEVAEVFLLQGTLTVLAVADGSATITVTAQDSDGNTVSDTFDVSVVGPPTPVSNLSCVAQTGQVLFQWDAPEWSGAEVYAYDYDLTRPDGKREQARLQGYPLVRAKGEYQAGQEASISVKAVYELADGSQVSSAAATLTCTVAE